jgi:hypothetical protein
MLFTALKQCKRSSGHRVQIGGYFRSKTQVAGHRFYLPVPLSGTTWGRQRRMSRHTACVLSEEH